MCVYLILPDLTLQELFCISCEIDFNCITYNFHQVLNSLKSKLSPFTHIQYPLIIFPARDACNRQSQNIKYITLDFTSKSQTMLLLNWADALPRHLSYHLLCKKQGWTQISCQQHILQYVYTTVLGSLWKVKAIIKMQPINAPLLHSAVFTFNHSVWKCQVSLSLSPYTAFHAVTTSNLL